MSINPQHNILRRYSLIIEIVKDAKNPPNNQQILDYLAENSCDIKERQLQRDREDILNSFGIDISYHSSKRGFVIKSTVTNNLQGLLDMLRLSNLMSLISEDYSTNQQTLNYLDFEQHSQFAGLEYIVPLLQSIKERKIISFNYTKFNNGEITTRVGHPYLLKLYLGRWYLVGKFYDKSTSNEGNTTNETDLKTTPLDTVNLGETPEKIRTFGLDRISNLQIYKQQYRREKGLNLKQLFSQVIGLNYTEHPVQPVILSFKAEQGNYIKSLPWHHSQTILIDNEQELRIELQVRPNYELKEQILKHIQATRIIEPQWLRAEIAQILQTTLQDYSKPTKDL